MADNKLNSEAPGQLALIRAVINTRYGRTIPDAWKSPEQTREWLIQRHLLALEATLSQGDHRRLIEMREALRSLLRHNNALPLVPEQIETLNHITKYAPLTVSFRLDGQAQLVPDSEGVDGVIGVCMGIVYTAMMDGTWTRLKVCHNDPCQAAFYDHTKNRSRTWCAMAKCGGRAKARAYRQRQKSASTPEM